MGEIICLVASPYNPAIETAMAAGPPHPFGLMAWADRGDWSFFGAETLRYFSDAGLTTGPDDVPANLRFEPRLLSSFNFTSRLYEGAEPDGRPSSGAGEIVLENGDGSFDAMLDLGWDGRKARLYRGQAGQPFSAFSLVFDGLIEGLDWSAGQIVMRLRDKQTIFSRPLQDVFFAGSGGYDGTADLAGLPRPLAFGYCPNVPPVMIDPNNLVLQVHDRQIAAVYAVRDKGSPLTFSANYGSYSSLIGATVPGGQYATCLARGLIRLGAEPDGLVTADVDGDADAAAEPQSSTKAIVRRIATRRLGRDNFSDPAQIDTAAFAEGSATSPGGDPGAYEVGFYVPPQLVAAGDVLSALTAGIGGWYDVSFAGVLSIGILAPPSGPADLVLRPSDLMPGYERTPAPISWARRVAYGRLSAVQSPDDLADTVSAADRAIYGAEARYARASDSSIRTRHKSAQEIVRESYFRHQADAQDVANSMITLHGIERDFYRMRLRPTLDPFALVRGSVVELAGFGRFTLGASKLFRLVGVDADRRTGEIAVTLWG